MSTLKKEHDLIKEKISSEEARKIDLAPDPFTAVDLLIANQTPPHICAMIDKMSPLGAAMVFGVIKMRASTTTGEYDVDFYSSIVKRGEELELGAIKGMTHAMNETTRIIGVTVF